MKTFISRIVNASALFAGFSILLMMFLGTFDILGTQVFGYPIPGTFELTEAFMIGAIFMAIPLAQSRRMHIAVDLFTSHLAPKTRRKFEFINFLLSFVFFFLIAWQGWIYGLHSLKVGEYESGLIPFPVYPAKMLLAVGASLVVLQCFKDIFEAAIELFKKST